jgi:putative ABC transport system substrate-binding protein
VKLRTIVSLALVALLFALCFPTEAQQPGKVYRIGYLSPGLGPAPRDEAFRQGLRERGYVEGKNIVIEYRYAEGKPDRLLELAAGLVALKIDIIVTSSTTGVLAARKATRTIPIVFAGVGDPVETGLVNSLARPGGNITGLTLFSAELSGKRIEILKETLPTISRIAYLWDANGPATGLKGAQTAASVLGLQLQPLELRNSNDFTTAFEAALKERAHALATSPGPIINTHRKLIMEFTAKNRLPAMYATTDFTDGGGLMSYAPTYTDLYRNAATYVDKILKGAKPADLPVEQPTKFELVINLKTVKQIGLTIPPSVLARADKVIK